MHRCWMIFALLGVASASADELHLLTMGPGSHVYMAGGHAALLVVKYEKDGQARTRMYDYGEADFESPSFAYDFVTGSARFYLANPGDLDWTVQKYGFREGRFIYRQKLNLTPTQVAAAVQRLAWESRPENREYIQHLLEANCATRIRDFLDDLTDGEIRRQFAFLPHEHTARHYQWTSLWGHPVIGLVADLFFGRTHDVPMDRYSAMLTPQMLRATLPLVRVNGQALVGPAVTIVEVPGEVSLAKALSWGTVLFSAVFLIVLVGTGAWAYGRESGWAVRSYGLAVLGWTILSSATGFFFLFLLVFSGIKETHNNEWFAAFVAMDIVLVPTAWRMLRTGQRGAWSNPRFAYLALRWVLVAGLLGGRPFGIFYQRPVSLALLAFGALSTFIVVGMPAHYAEGAVKLLAKYHPRQLVRKRLRA